MKSDTYIISINDEARPLAAELSPPGSVHEYPSPSEATGAAAAAQQAESLYSAPRVVQATAGEENVVSSSGLRASSGSSSNSNDADSGNKEAKDEASGGGGGALNVEMSVDSSYSRVDDQLRVTIDLRVPMRSVSRTVDGVNLKLVDSKDRVARLQPRCIPTPRNEWPTKPKMSQLDFEWNEYERRPSMPDIKLDVNVKGDARPGRQAVEEAAEVPAKPPRQQITPEPLTNSQPSQEVNRRTVREEAPRRTNWLSREDMEKMLGIDPRLEKPSPLDKPGPVGAFAQTSNFVMNMVEKQKQIRDEARATSRAAATETTAAASVSAPEAFRDLRISRSTTTTTTSTTTTTTATATTSSNRSDPPSYSTCVSQNDPVAREQQRPTLIQYAPPSYSAAVTQQFQQQLQSSKESFVSLLEQRRSTTCSSSSNSSAAETETRSSTLNLATFLRPPRMSPRPMISPSAPPHPANPEAEFYNQVIETAMKRAGPFANQLDVKDVLARASFPLMPEPWVPRPMRPYVIGNEEPYRGPETAAEYLERVAQVRGRAQAAQQRTSDDLATEELARPPAPRTPNPELRVETSSQAAYQRIDYDLRVHRDSPGAERSEWDLRIEPLLPAAAARRSEWERRVQRERAAAAAAPRSEFDLRVHQRSPPASPRNDLQMDPSAVTDLKTDLRDSLMRAGLPLDFKDLSEADYDRALTEMHRVMERAKSMLENLRINAKSEIAAK
uniref:Uncharacterized protein n=1 Tax=Trichogramma kaykai TaxID=54128 RepID=A0ABD2XPM1_9HYME